ncbi:MAG: DUF364 domain-containing protein [Elusimicrobiota bacterium]
MWIIEDILASIREDSRVEEVRACVFWTAVVSRRCGLASTPRECSGHAEGPSVRDIDGVDGKSALQLARLALSESPVEAAIGVAALNSLLEADPGRCIERNAAELLLEKGAGKRVAVVGNFPFVPKLRRVAGTLWVFERSGAEGTLPETEAERLLPESQVVAISGSALVNGTMDGLLSFLSPAAFVMVLGPSTPLSEVFFDYGVDVVCGTQVTDSAQVLRDISRGACFRQVRGTRLLAMARDAGRASGA